MKFKSTKFFFSIFAATALLCFAAIVPARANDTATPTKNLVETAAAAGDFTILAKALAATGLDAELKKGEYTVFAPTDEAFKKLPPKALENLMADKEGFRRILLYHVVKDKYTAEQVTKLGELETLQGSKLTIKVKPEKVKINRSSVVKTDVFATNGVIHAIDRLMTPQ